MALSDFDHRFWVLFDISVFHPSQLGLEEKAAALRLDVYHPTVQAFHAPQDLMYVITRFPCYEVTLDLKNTSVSSLG